MKTRNMFKTLLPRVLMTLAVVIYLPVFSACQSKTLSRAQAQKMIVETEDYRQIATLDYINRSLREDGKGTVEATAADEPEASAIQYRINEYYMEEPRVQIAQHLGFVEPHLKRLNEQPKKDSSLYKYGFWFFDEKWTNTQKGKKLWADYKLPAQETVVPLAKREFVDVTGITKISESQTGVEFTWRWMPNELGKALDPASDKFKALPANMQKNLTENAYKLIPKFTYDWSGNRAGRATFQKYDDGWRLVSVAF